MGVTLEIETLYGRRPFANWLIIAVCVILLAVKEFTVFPFSFDARALQGWNAKGLLWSMFLHADLEYLVGSECFLGIFQGRRPEGRDYA